MRQSKPKMERMPSSTSLNSLKELRRRVSVDSMAEESTDGAQNLEYEVTLVSTLAFGTFFMNERLCVEGSVGRSTLVLASPVLFW